MAKYFVKWLPNREIKITDPHKVMFKIEDKWTEPGESDSYLGNQIEEVAQGELSLCTHEISPGDTVMQDGIYIEFKWTLMMDSCLSASDVFKKVGIIMKEDIPNMKEGHTYTEYDVFPHHTHDEETEEIIYLDENDMPTKVPVWHLVPKH